MPYSTLLVVFFLVYSFYNLIFCTVKIRMRTISDPVKVLQCFFFKISPRVTFVWYRNFFWKNCFKITEKPHMWSTGIGHIWHTHFLPLLLSPRLKNWRPQRSSIFFLPVLPPKFINMLVPRQIKHLLQLNLHWQKTAVC